MFNLQLALLRWNGQQVSLNDLQKLLSNLRLEYLGEIPPEIGVRELLLPGARSPLDRRGTDGPIAYSGSRRGSSVASLEYSWMTTRRFLHSVHRAEDKWQK